jgi:hypothetical protein
MNAFGAAAKFFEAGSHYVYILKMGKDAGLSDMTKLWAAPWAMKEPGWM